MTKKKTSPLLAARVDKIKQAIFNHKNWKRKHCFKRRWKISRSNLVRKLNNFNDAHVITLSNIAENIGVSLGGLLGLGRWEYDPAELPQRIKLLREMKDINRHALSKLCGFSPPYIHKIEKGLFKRCLKFSSVETIARVLKVSIREILSNN